MSLEAYVSDGTGIEGELYRRVACGEFQQQVSTIAGIEYHPDYLSANRKVINTVYHAQHEITDFLEAYTANNEKPVSRSIFHHYRAAHERDNAHEWFTDVALRRLCNIGLIDLADIKFTSTDDVRLFFAPQPAAYKLNHERPLYKTDRNPEALLVIGGLASISTMTTLAPAELSLNALTTATAVGIGAAGGVAAMRMSARAVLARRYYRAHGF